jgi:hypothetical protein
VTFVFRMFAGSPTTIIRMILAWALCAWGINAVADANSLRERYGELRQELTSNNYQRPLFIASADAGDSLRGDVYAVLNYRFEEVSGALKDPAHWCDILILPFNTKYCRPLQAGGGAALDVRIGRKFDQPVRDAYRLQFALQPVAALPDYFESRLSSESGPMGTRDYRIAVAATPIDGDRTFLHLRYSYGYGTAGRFAMQAYLSTVGADKVGFTVTGRDGQGAPIYIGGVRGAIERTAMRYYLAVDAHLSSRRAPPGEQLDKRIQAWFDATERYPRQLHEMDRSTYLAMKRSETERQQALVN